MTCLRQFRFRRRGTDHQFRAAFFVVSAASMGAVDFERDLADALAVLAQFGVNGIPALRPFRVLGLELLHGLGALLHLLGQRIQSELPGLRSLASIAANLLASTSRSLARISSRSRA